MARRARRGDATVLRLRLDRGSGAERGLVAGLAVVFELLVNGEPVFHQHVDAGALRLPTSFEDARRLTYREPRFAIPRHLLEEIRSHTRGLPRGAPIWLELAHPTGTLPLLPWERMLQSRVPVLRRPYFDLQPDPYIDAFDVVLCASAPAAKDNFDAAALLLRVTREIIDGLPERAVVHVFADRATHGAVQQDLVGLARSSPAGRGTIRVHDPEESAAYTVPPGDGHASGAVEVIQNPWLRWIHASFVGSGRSVDVVHFICHGYLTRDQGAIALAESPLVNQDREWARFVGASELSTFLTQVGALSLGLTSPERNFSRLGLRLLVDQVARTRPGSALLHDADGGLPLPLLEGELDPTHLGQPLPVLPPGRVEAADPPRKRARHQPGAGPRAQDADVRSDDCTDRGTAK
jgi:hypothetical protein